MWASEESVLACWALLQKDCVAAAKSPAVHSQLVDCWAHDWVAVHPTSAPDVYLLPGWAELGHDDDAAKADGIVREPHDYECHVGTHRKLSWWFCFVQIYQVTRCSLTVACHHAMHVGSFYPQVGLCAVLVRKHVCRHSTQHSHFLLDVCCHAHELGVGEAMCWQMV